MVELDTYFARSPSPLVIMRHIFTAVCLVGLVALTANAHTLPEEESSVDAVFANAAQEAVYLGEILRDVADTLEKDEELSAEGEEYFFRDLWNKTKEAVKNAAKKMKTSVKGAYKEAKDNIKKATKEAKDKLKEKAFKIVSELLSKVTSGYAADETDRYGKFMRKLLKMFRQAEEQLRKAGNSLGQLQHS
ncbi:uncharacterized protein LOC119386836 [Rhipicephalus sanguineus]|uniref:uncharacterized protein LOC119386836 n=1 Tax=Rhipicephalus sanguineus TaxID=34632 RepID=UPI00189565C2|nr:uncharacterized protein LOC119386836 [Rhipicephalus sanguineus]